MADIVLTQIEQIPSTMQTRFKDADDGTHAQVVATHSAPKSPADFIYQYLQRTSGPAGTNAYDMNTNSGTGSPAPSVFEYQVPANRTFKLVRINFIIVDGSINPGDFGGISGALTNGCLFQIIDDDGSTEALDFTGGVPIATNADFGPLAGVDIPISELVGDDQLPIRFTIAKAGAMMRLTAGQRVRWTNRDNVSAITKFRAMVQGVLV